MPAKRFRIIKALLHGGGHSSPDSETVPLAVASLRALLGPLAAQTTDSEAVVLSLDRSERTVAISSKDGSLSIRHLFKDPGELAAAKALEAFLSERGIASIRQFNTPCNERVPRSAVRYVVYPLPRDADYAAEHVFLLYREVFGADKADDLSVVRIR